MDFTEEQFENAVIQLFRDTLGYRHVYAPDVEREYRDVLYFDVLSPSLERVNPTLPTTAIRDAINRLREIEGSTIEMSNVVFMHYLQNGISVSYVNDKNEEIDCLVRLVDYEMPEYNSFIIANQWTIVENSTRIPDLIVFLNGLPIVVLELKSPSREETDASEGFTQLRNYRHEIPSLFNYNAFLAISDMTVSKAGTITASEDRFMEWKTKDGNYEDTRIAGFDTFVEGMFDKVRLLNILKNFICFSGGAKILAAYHQYFAVQRAVVRTEHAVNSDGKGGVVWHTQGSGKSLSMVFYAHMVMQSRGIFDNPTIVVLTDRNDLDDQLYLQFAKCSNFLRAEPKKSLVQAESRKHLNELLNDRFAGGIFFTTMQKFEESEEPLSERRNIVVMADEAHRGQYGLDEKIDAKTGKITTGIARIIRNSLPNATYIGFTGTPISSKDKSTIEVFGDYIDVYDMTQAVEDGATRPVYYESRVLHLKLSENILERIDAEYDFMAENAETHAIDKSKQELSRLDSILGAEQTVDTLVNDILQHYEDNRKHELTGKAMIVAYSRPIAIDIYHKILELRPSWRELVCVVMTSSNKDPEEWRAIVGNKKHKARQAKKFKDNDSSLKIAIVVDMWLTGFDVPSLATMYVYKPMKGHNLMQAIARVNRVYKEKEGGLVVDYVGIAGALKEAMQEYTKRDGDNFGNPNIAETALVKFHEKLDVCRDMLHGFDYSVFLDKTSTELVRAGAITGGVNFLANRTKEQEKESFIKEAQLLKNAMQLCRSLVNEADRFEAAYFIAVRTMLTRIVGNSKPLSLKEINGRINELLKASIKSEGVINLFSNVESGVNLFDSSFLEEIAKMKEKNLAFELLKKLIAEQVAGYKKTNLVKSEKFSEMLQRAMNSYLNGKITNEEVIAELMKMAKEMRAADEKSNDLGLSHEELAFYDALTKPQAVKDLYENEQLVELTRELAEQLRKSRTVDWQKKESARAGMRRMIKRLLKKYDYPPEGYEFAIRTVITQCEMWVDFS